MKILISILLLIITFNCNAQYSLKKKLNDIEKPSIETRDLFIPVTILASTFVTVELLHSAEHDQKTLNTVAFTGMATSALSYGIVRIVKNNTPKKIRKKRIKRHCRL